MIDDIRIQHSLAKQIVILVVLFSSVITIITTAYQLYGSYTRDLSIIENQFQEIKKVHLNSLSRILWVADKNEAVFYLEGILAIRGVKYTKIEEAGQTWLEMGVRQRQRFISKVYPLKYWHRGQLQKIGAVTIEMTLEGVYQHIYTQLWPILVGNAIKTFLVAGFILFIFNALVGRHIKKISDYLVQLTIKDDVEDLSLERKGKHKHDELDVLLASITSMRQNLSGSIREVNENEARLNLILDTVEEGVYGLDKDGLCTFVNSSCLQMLGYESEDELVGKNLHSLIHHSYPDGSHYPLDLCNVRIAMHSQCSTHSAEEVHWRKDGSSFPVEYWARPIINQGQLEGAVVTFIDISERVENELLMARSLDELSYYKYAVDQHSLVSITDIDGNIVYANSMFCMSSGYTLEELLGHSHNILNSNYHNEEFYENLWQKISSGLAWKGEIKNRGKHGGLFWTDTTIIPHIDRSGKPDRYIALRTDITEKKIIEQEREIQANRWKKLSRLGIGLTGDAENIFHQICKSISELLDINYIAIYEVEKKSSQLISDYAGSDDIVFDKSIIDDFFISTVISSRETEVHKSENWLQVGLPAINYKNEVDAVVIIVMDSNRQLAVVDYELIKLFLQRITSEIEHKRSYKEQDHLEHQLQQSQKMEALGLLAGGIAHDFNNMLSAILGYSYLAKDVLSKDTNGNADLIDYVQQIHSAGERARDLIQQMMMFSRNDDREVSMINVPVVVKEVTKLLRSTLPTTITIQVHADEDLPLIEASAVSIYQILMNLCVNARDAIDEKGVVNIYLKKIQVSRETCIACGERFEGDYIVVEVEDNGSGVESEAFEEIFMPFFTTKEVGKGTGMGLSMVNNLTHRYHGHLLLQSRFGVGTKFSIFLPVVTENNADTVTDNQIPAGLARLEAQDKHILVVDDEMSVARLHGQLLESCGFRVSVETDGLSALELFENNPAKFDIVVTDQTMPKMTGGELAVNLLKIKPDLPVILCTGYSEHLSEEDALKLGIKAYLMKPVKTRTMIDTIRELLDLNGQNTVS